MIYLYTNAVAVVGLERTFYDVLESVGVVEVCAIVYQPDGGITCPIAFPFNVSLSTRDGTAGNGSTALIKYALYLFFFPTS